MHIKEGCLQLKQDIKEWYKGVIAAMVYVVVANIMFGNICTMVVVTGLPCPACGLTRAGISFLTFQWEQAWNYNCVIFLIIPLIIYWFSCRYLFQCQCRGLVPCLVLIAFCLMGLYVYRMIIYFPHTSPMIYNKNNLLFFLKDVIQFFKTGF